MFSPAFRRRLADAEKSRDRLSVKGPKDRRSLLALDGRSGMDQASTQRTASGTDKGNALLFVCAKRNLGCCGRRPLIAPEYRPTWPMPFSSREAA